MSTIGEFDTWCHTDQLRTNVIWYFCVWLRVKLDEMVQLEADTRT